MIMNAFNGHNVYAFYKSQCEKAKWKLRTLVTDALVLLVLICENRFHSIYMHVKNKKKYMLKKYSAFDNTLFSAIGGFLLHAIIRLK